MTTQSSEESGAISVDVSADGLSVSAQGQTVNRITDALADIISPFSGALGFLGDQLSFARRVAAIKAARTAKDMLEKEGIYSGQVPPRILLPWLEGASLETEAEGNLTDRWAGLLARAVKSSDAVNTSYIETLRRIGSKEAELLSLFATDTSPDCPDIIYGLLPHAELEAKGMFLEVLERFDDFTEIDQWKEVFETLLLQHGGQIIFFSVDGSPYYSTEYFEENQHAVANLEHLGLIRRRTAQLNTEVRRYRLVWFSITSYAFDFVWACHGVVTGTQARRKQLPISSKER